MNVQPENQVGPRDLLEIIYDRCVAFVRGNQLVHPVGKRMGSGRSDLDSVPSGERRQFLAKLHYLPARIADIVANLASQL